MANPNDAVGTNGAFGGRTSVNAFNDVLSAFSGRGILSGWSCSPSSGLTVALGGNGSERDTAIAEDNSGNKTTVNNISQAPVKVAVNSAPASNSRIDAVVAYIEASPNGSGVTDNPDVVNLLVVSGAVAATPVRPTDNAIRTAITADGASGATAYYVVLAYITIPSGTTDVDATMISVGDGAALVNGMVGTDSIANSAVTSDKLDFTTFTKISGMPTAETNFKLAWGTIDCSAVRWGSLVFFSGTFVKHFTDNFDQQPFTDILPSGFRPTFTQYVPFVMTTADAGDGSFTFNADGSGALSCRAQTVAQRYMYSAVWVTNDDWPS